MDYKEIFDQYLDGRLSGEELKEFEKILREDPGLAGELDQYKKLHYLSENLFSGTSADQPPDIDDMTDQQAKDDIAGYKKLDVAGDIDLQNFRQNLQQAVRRRISLSWFAAAVVLAGIVTIAFLLLRNSQVEMPGMYARYYEPYHPSEKIFEITRSNDDLYFAVQVFESGDYSRAAPLFNQLADSLAFSSCSHFYTGLIYIHQEKWEKAIESFKQVLADADSDIINDARWYLGLCYLRVENAPAAREQFELLLKSENDYSKRAGKILRHLD